MNTEIKKVLNDVDTAFEVVRISWDNPTPQAVSAINEAWTQVRKHLGIVHLGTTDPAQEFGKPALKHTNQTVTLTDERRLDMLTGALEGGSNYWYEIKETADAIIRETTPEMQGRPFVDRMFMCIKQGRAIQVHDCENDELLGEVTMQAIEEGERLMQEKHPEHFADILSEDDDATTADVWFQMVVLKELVYG